MLGYEDGMPPHRRLPTIVLRLGVTQPLDNEASAVLQDDGEGLLVQVRRFLCPKPKATAELALRQGCKQLVRVAHPYSSLSVMPLCRVRS
jgi:hypothetical protein